MRSPRRWAAAVELDFWVSTSWIHMKPIRGRWFEKCFQMTIQKRLEKKRSIFEEFLHEIEPIQRMKRKTVGGKKFMKVFFFLLCETIWRCHLLKKIIDVENSFSNINRKKLMDKILYISLCNYICFRVHSEEIFVRQNTMKEII